MARRAVQGYSEKTFFENGRFLGMLATSDPLQEGYFKHLVNLDIADTGLSLKPRKGFLTTGVLKNEHIIALSDHSVIYKDNRTQTHVIYDFSSNRGFLVDVSRYNIEDKLLPYYKEIALFDWIDTIDILKEKFQAVQDVFDSYSATGEDSQYGGALSYIRKHITILPETITPNAIDLYGVSKTIFKVIIKDDETDIDAYLMDETYLLMAMYYRENAVEYVTPNLAANTLVFELLDMDEHKSYIDRNIASTDSLIPDPFQTVYNLITGDALERPAGTVNTFGILYVQNLTDDRYYINHVVKDDNHLFIPHMTINPAEYVLNPGAGEVARYAYKFDIVSSKSDVSVIDVNLDVDSIPDDYGKYRNVIYRGTWRDLTDDLGNVLATPTPSLPFPTATSDLLSLSDENHINSITKVITLVGDSYASTTDSTYPGDDWYTANGSLFTRSELASAVGVSKHWSTLLANIKNRTELIEALETLVAGLNQYEPYRMLIQELNLESTAIEYISASSLSDGNNYLDAAELDAAPTLEEFIVMLKDGTFADEQLIFAYQPIRAYFSDTLKYRLYSVDTVIYDADLQLNPNFIQDENVTEDDGYHDIYIYRQDDIPERLIWFSEYSYINPDRTYDFFNAGKIQFTTDDLKNTGLFPDLAAKGFFDAGYQVIMYMIPYMDTEVEDKTIAELHLLYKAWESGAYKFTRQVIYGDAISNTSIPEFIETDPGFIQESKQMLMFQGNLMVTWHSNRLYISEPGDFANYKEINKFEYAEKIVKVIEFKTILLVFTTQHLYAIYSDTEDTITTDGEGAQTIITTVFWGSQKVLYNILTSAKYADVIQVFNEFILFYSEDGQLFLIKPNVMIDSETRFSLKYFNQSANDVLLNYDEYINERLTNYNIDATITKDDVMIKALLSVNFIKIFFYVPGYITYMLIFDVIQNRFFVYDTITFTDIVDKMFIDSGEVYITRQDSKLYFTFPYQEPNEMNNIVDMSLVSNFKKIAISGLIDSGNMSLNNHLRKRFMKLHTVFKNLSASHILYNVETEIDDVISHPYYETQLEVKDVGGISYYVAVPKTKSNDIVDLINTTNSSDIANAAFLYAMENSVYEEDSVLMNFEEYTSSKLLTHKSSALGMGKVLRVKMQFISKGDFKIQSFGIVYKERRI